MFPTPTEDLVDEQSPETTTTVSKSNEISFVTFVACFLCGDGVNLGCFFSLASWTN